MWEEAAIVKFGEIRNKPVVSVAAAGRLGFVDDVLVDTSSAQVRGFIVRSGGLFTHREAVLLRDVRSAGEDAVTVEDASRLNAREKFSDFAGTVTGGDLFRSRVMTESGREVGWLADLDFEIGTGQIARWILHVNLLERLRKEEHSIPPETVKSFGPKLVVVRDGVSVP
jgi:uncharacterized protein YrrD